MQVLLDHVIIAAGGRRLHRDQRDLAAVDRDLDIVRLCEPFDVLVAIARQANVDFVLRVVGERVRHGQSAARAQRETRERLFLREIGRKRDGIAAGQSRRPAGAEPAALAGGLGATPGSGCSCVRSGGSVTVSPPGNRDVRPSASRLILRAASTYRSSSVGESVPTVTLSNPWLASSEGSSALTSTSSASRSRMALGDSVRFSRRNASVLPGFGRAAAALSSRFSMPAMRVRYESSS